MIDLHRVACSQRLGGESHEAVRPPLLFVPLNRPPLGPSLSSLASSVHTRLKFKFVADASRRFTPDGSSPSGLGFNLKCS